MRIGVENHLVVARACQLAHCAGGDRICGMDHRGQVALGIFVDPIDARARQDVVELVREEQLPGCFQLGRGVAIAKRDRPCLRLPQCLLGAPVEALGA